MGVFFFPVPPGVLLVGCRTYRNVGYVPILKWSYRTCASLVYQVPSAWYEHLLYRVCDNPRSGGEGGGGAVGGYPQRGEGGVLDIMHEGC